MRLSWCNDCAMVRFLAHSLFVVILTLLTQIGGLAWVIAAFFRYRLVAFFVAYATLTTATIWIAPQFGRVALSCFDDGPLEVQGWMYCALNRNYVSPVLHESLVESAKRIEQQFPGTHTLVLDANFPFMRGFPLLPHLSHDDGDKVDLALYYRDDTDYLPGVTRSPIGYFAFEDGPSECSGQWPTLRWDFSAVQSFWPAYELDTARTSTLLDVLANDSRVEKILIEPHLARRFGVSHPKIRFQGCRAARHDDHIHFQVR